MFVLSKNNMNKKRKMTAEEILRICTRIAKQLEGLSISPGKLKEACTNPIFGENLVAIIENAGNLPRISVPKVETLRFLEGDEILTGRDFMKRARALAHHGGKKALGGEDYDFLKQAENHHLLPMEGEKIVVFLGTNFESEGDTYIRALQHDEESASWSECCFDITQEFDWRFEVAVSSVGELLVLL